VRLLGESSTRHRASAPFPTCGGRAGFDIDWQIGCGGGVLMVARR
jgi:hypothetical protein